MFSSNTSPPTTLTPSPRSNLTLPSVAAKSLPSGGCRFILLHPSIPDQRCSCQGFRRNENRPGANCECGHQACYHATSSCNPCPEVEAVSPSASQNSLMDRISRLEEQYLHDRKVWQEELKEERRARREDTRVLREAMYAFYKFMEREVPDKFVSVEDKIDGVVDQMLRLQERVGMIDDSTMALENRLTDLEDDGDDDHVPELEKDDEEKIDDGPKAKRHRTEPPQNAFSSQDSPSQQCSISRKRTSNSLQDTPGLLSLMAPPERPSRNRLAILPSCASSKSDSAVPTDSAAYPNSDFATALEFLNGPAPMGAHTYVHILSSPQDLISPLLTNENGSAHRASNSETVRKDSAPEVLNPSRADSLERPFPILTRPQTSFRSSFPLSTSMLKKRRRDVVVLRVEASGDGSRESLPLSISNPPPLSLS